MSYCKNCTEFEQRNNRTRWEWEGDCKRYNVGRNYYTDSCQWIKEAEEIKETYVDGDGDGKICVMFPGEKPIVIEKKVKSSVHSEHLAVLEAIKRLESNKEYEMRSDSTNVVGHLMKNWKINEDHLQEAIDDINHILNKENIKINLEHVAGKDNIASQYLKNLLEDLK